MNITSAMASMLFTNASSSTSTVDFSFLTQNTSTGTTANVGSVKSALVNAEKNEAQQLAQAAKDPQVQKDLARYEKVVKNAKTIDDVKRFYEAKVPMNRGCRTQDVMKAVLYLIEQAYETGQAVPVTGGQVMLN